VASIKIAYFIVGGIVMGSASWGFRKFARFFYLQTVLAIVIVCSYLISGGGQEPSAAQPAWRADDWITINKDYSSQRYVDLDQITPNNVSQLNEVCEINLNEPSWFSSGILKIGRTLYVTTRRMTYAIDGATCGLRWRYVLNDDALKVGNPGSSNQRGVAYLDGALFRGTADGRLIALNAKTGQLLWQIQNGNQDKGESIIAAPIAWEGKVFVGIATADFGVRGDGPIFRWRFLDQLFARSDDRRGLCPSLQSLSRLDRQCPAWPEPLHQRSPVFQCRHRCPQLVLSGSSSRYP
jgi:PQQ-like domain